MSNAWESLCKELAEALHVACAEALPGAELRVEDRTVNMLAEEDDPNVVPFYPIGNIYQFHVRELRTRNLFGWKRLPYRRWATIVSFGMEEMWNAPIWAEKEGLRCHVWDARIADAVRPAIKRFSAEHHIPSRIT